MSFEIIKIFELSLNEIPYNLGNIIKHEIRYEKLISKIEKIIVKTLNFKIIGKKLYEIFKNAINFEAYLFDLGNFYGFKIENELPFFDCEE